MSESSLSRIWKHNELHDAGALTAFRTASDCGNGTVYTNKDNQKRNKLLIAKIQSKGYGATKLVGTYPEGGKTATEISFFVVDLNDTGKLFDDLKKWSEEFEQDSFLMLPKGTVNGDDKGFLYGTNRCENNWLGYGKKELFNKGRAGRNSDIYTSKVGGRPFIFEGVDFSSLLPGNGFGVQSMHIIAEKHWSELSD